MTINGLVDTVADIAGISVQKRHEPGAPQGVRGRNSDNSIFRETYGWEPSTSLRAGLEQTFEWIEAELEDSVAPSRGGVP